MGLLVVITARCGIDIFSGGGGTASASGVFVKGENDAVTKPHTSAAAAAKGLSLKFPL